MSQMVSRPTCEGRGRGGGTGNARTAMGLGTFASKDGGALDGAEELVLDLVSLFPSGFVAHGSSAVIFGGEIVALEPLSVA